MFVGIQFEAPEGFGSFRKGVRYYFAGDRTHALNGDEKRTALVVWFEKSKSWRVRLMAPERDEFEAALTSSPRRLRICSKQFNLPPWMEEVDDVNFDEIEERRAMVKRRATTPHSGEVHEEKKSSCRQQMESRLFKIASALDRSAEILTAADPLKLIASTAYEPEKAYQPYRIQLWFFAYVLHGENLWALKQPTHRNGRWSRQSPKHRDTKYGRNAPEGSCFGWSSASMRDDIVGYYLAYCALGKTMTSIHGTVLRERYGCVIEKDARGNDTFMHPENKPFPSYSQFRYVVVSELTLEHVQKQVYGAPRIRSKATANDGCQTEQYANLMEDVQVDAYFVSERPKSMFSNEPSEALCVAEAVCVTSAAVVGVGFSLGSETQEAYNSMLFCMAVDKTYIAHLYGIPEQMLNWIMRGLCPSFTSDRGPAGHRTLGARLQEKFPIKTIMPSHDGQSKAPVESTHPRDVQLEGAPTYRVSKLNVPQMIRREVLRAASKNHTKDISPRLSDEAIRDFEAEGRVATPHHYWDYLSKRLRTCARQMTLKQAVRSFWTPRSLRVDRDGVKLGHRHYTSAALRASGFMKQVGRTKDLEISAFTLTLVARYIWVEVEGDLLELEATTRVRIDDEDRFVPLSELEETSALLSALRSRTRISVQAANSRAQADFEEITGVPWSAGGRRQGVPKKPAGTDAHEVKILKGQRSAKAA